MTHRLAARSLTGVARGTVLAGALLLGAGCTLVTNRVIEPQLNRVVPVAATAAAWLPTPADHAALHRSLFIADLHADTLMWSRDLLARDTRGHVDLPRLMEGGVDLQVFTIVTKTPNEIKQASGTPPHCVLSDTLNTTGLLAVAQGRPLRTWTSLRERALYQARRLDRAAFRSRARPGPELRLIRSGGDLSGLLDAVERGEAVVGAVLGIEGANWIGLDEADEPTTRAQVREMFAAGVRSFAPTHRYNNALGGSSEGCPELGLFPQGEWALREAEALGMVIDLAHASPSLLRQALAILRGPVVISHTGVQVGCVKPCYAPRNLSDEEIRMVATQGGVIGIGFWPEAVGAGGLDAILRNMRHVVRVLSEPAVQALHPRLDPFAHIAFGGDFDGAVDVPFDATGLPTLTGAMIAEMPDTTPMTLAELRRVAGRNVCRVLAERLPGGGADLAGRCENAGRAPGG